MKFNKMLFKSCAFFSLFYGYQAIAECNEYVLEAVSADRYHIEDAGEAVRDTVTGLKWRRCLEGTVLNNNATPDVFSDDSCQGEASMLSRDAALKKVHELSDAYRLPNIKELASIAKLSCRNPAIEEAVFPSQPSQWVWSATASDHGQHPLGVKFDLGMIGLPQGNKAAIRLIVLED